MIYDTFLFFNELKLLEVRLNELDPVVDHFVLVESTLTHSNKAKALVFHENQEQFRKFTSKIIHVVVEDGAVAWNPEGKQRFAIEDRDRRAVSRGLVSCKPNDIILHGDVDEIPRAEAVADLRQRMKFRTIAPAVLGQGLLRQPWVVRLLRNLFKKHHPFVWVLEQRPLYFHLNSQSLSIPCWPGTRATFYRDFTSAYDLRRWDGHRVPDAGWHFSYMGGAERVRQKLQAYAHQEYNTPEFTDLRKIQEALLEGRWLLGPEHRLQTVAVDDSFPRFITQNLEQFRLWIRTDTPEASR